MQAIQFQRDRRRLAPRRFPQVRRTEMEEFCLAAASAVPRLLFHLDYLLLPSKVQRIGFSWKIDVGKVSPEST